MKPEETHDKIWELLSVATDGEASQEERAIAEETIGAEPESASHAAFLKLLRESTLAAPRVEMPASLSERIALATYARPSLWSRIVSALRPAPIRYATGGLALSGLAVLGLVLLRPTTVAGPTPGPVEPTPAAVAFVKPTPAPILPTPEPKTLVATPAPVQPTSAPEATPEPSQPVEPIVLPEPTFVPPLPKATDREIKPTPAPVPKPKASPLAPARLAEPPSGTLSVASESLDQGVMSSGTSKGLTESDPVIAEPRSASVAGGSTAAAAHGDPAEIGSVKIALHQGREKLSALTGQASGAGQPTSSRISVVTDADKR
jgi:hypothetical protein